MSTIEDLRAKLAFLREQGVTGPVEIDGVKLTIPLPPVTNEDKDKIRKDRQKEYDQMLFAATEGISDEVET